VKSSLNIVVIKGNSKNTNAKTEKSENKNSNKLIQSMNFYEGCAFNDKSKARCAGIMSCSSDSVEPIVLKFQIAKIWEGIYFDTYPVFKEVLKAYYEGVIGQSFICA
jgi:hypothetical protein